MTVGTVAVLVNADGTEKIVKKSVAAKDGVQLIVDEDTTVKLVDKAKNFKDTKKHWAKDSIDFVSALRAGEWKEQYGFCTGSKNYPGTAMDDSRTMGRRRSDRWKEVVQQSTCMG